MLVTPIKESFPTIRQFPECHTHGTRAMLIRLFPSDTRDKDIRFIHMALWCMRSILVNTDMMKFGVQPVFHIKEQLCTTAVPILRDAGVPDECMVTFPDDLCHKQTSVRGQNWQAVAPLIDTQLDRFEHIIIIDADMLAVRPEGVTEKIRLVHASLNLFAPNALTMSKGWRPMANKELTKLWIRVSGKSIDEWVQAVATWCNAPSGTIEDIMLTSDRRRKKPGLNGMYINVPMSCLSAEMREFLRDCSAELGHEEVALAVWYLRHFIKTGKRLPRYSLENKVPRALDLPHLRDYEAQHRAVLYHPEPLAALQESAGDFALSLGGEPEEIEGFVKSCEYWETHNRRYAEENA